MCLGGTLPLRATCSINANCPLVSSPVARNVSSQPLYQTDRSSDCRPLPNAAILPNASPSSIKPPTSEPDASLFDICFDICFLLQPGVIADERRLQSRKRRDFGQTTHFRDVQKMGSSTQRGGACTPRQSRRRESRRLA